MGSILKILHSLTILFKSSGILNTLSLSQTLTHYFLREGRIFEINPIDQLTQIDDVTIIKRKLFRRNRLPTRTLLDRI